MAACGGTHPAPCMGALPLSAGESSCRVETPPRAAWEEGWGEGGGRLLMSRWGVAEPLGPLVGSDSPSTPPLAPTSPPPPQFPHSGRSGAQPRLGRGGRQDGGRSPSPNGVVSGRGPANPATALGREDRDVQARPPRDSGSRGGPGLHISPRPGVPTPSPGRTQRPPPAARPRAPPAHLPRGAPGPAAPEPPHMAPGAGSRERGSAPLRPPRPRRSPRPPGPSAAAAAAPAQAREAGGAWRGRGRLRPGAAPAGRGGGLATPRPGRAGASLAPSGSREWR